MKDCRQFYIDGKWVAPAAASDFSVTNPATEETIATISLGGIADVNKAVAAARDRLDGLGIPMRAQGLAQDIDILGEVRLFNEALGPDPVQEGALGQDLTGMFDEGQEGFDHLRAERDGLVIDKQQQPFDVKVERSEHVEAHALFLTTPVVPYQPLLSFASGTFEVFEASRPKPPTGQIA